MSENPKILKEIPKVVQCCPLCQAPFENPVSANVKLRCPEEKDGGCGQEFEVRMKSS